MQPQYTMLNKLLIALIAFYASWAQAEPEPIELTVTADKVEISDESSVSTYSGNAKATRGETYITADMIEIIHPDQELESIHITGKPAFVNYVSEDKQTKVKASANTIDYNIKKEILILKGNAKVINAQNSIAAEYIKLNKKTNELYATAAAKSQVTTVFEMK